MMHATNQFMGLNRQRTTHCIVYVAQLRLFPSPLTAKIVSLLSHVC
jgi:hypothetical protein